MSDALEEPLRILTTSAVAGLERDASLQSGHLNDFIEVGGAIYRAAVAASAEGLTDDTISQSSASACRKAAHYAQRSGRAGRSAQPALVFTYCSFGSPHDHLEQVSKAKFFVYRRLSGAENAARLGSVSDERDRLQLWRLPTCLTIRHVAT